MTTPQSGILPEANSHATFVTLNVTPGEQNLARVRQISATIPAKTDLLSTSYPDSNLSSTISISSSIWDKLYPQSRPEALRPFPALKDSNRQAPVTPGDLLLHIRADHPDVIFELLQQVMNDFGDSVSVVEEVNGFRYLDSRDLTGFVDGTENPEGEARASVALVTEEDSAFTGGCYIHAQRYIHNLKSWNQQPVQEQEQIIGRTKADNIEFTSEQKAPTAHIKRTNIKDAHGKTMEILRHSTPYGNARESGLQFISYCHTPLHFELMLKAMIKADAHGHFDHLMNFSNAITGGAFFAPAIEYLRENAG